MPIVNNIRAEFIPVNFEKPAVLKQKTIQANGVYNASDDNADGFSSVTVVVPKPAPNLQELNITPSTEPQTITVPGTIDGYGPVNVSGVENVLPENIRENVTILGVTGTAHVPERYIEFTNNNQGFLSKTARQINLANVTKLARYVLVGGYTDCDFSNQTINMSSIQEIGPYSCLWCFSGVVADKIDFSGVTTIGFHGCDSMCAKLYLSAANIKEIDFSGLERVGVTTRAYQFNNFCKECQGLEYVNFGSLKLINTGVGTTNNGCFQNAFSESTLHNINMQKLEIIRGAYAMSYCFSDCKNLTPLELSSLVYVSGNYALRNFCTGCTSLTSVSFLSLKSLDGTSAMVYAFSGCSALQHLYYPALRVISVGGFSDLCNNIPSITLHFPSNMQSTIEGMSGYSTTAPFGAVSGTVLFDLPATNLLTGANTTVYERNPKYDTATALAWRVQDSGNIPDIVIDWTPFYTNGTTDPQVGDTLYSDAECTTAVTTIDSIA